MDPVTANQCAKWFEELYPSSTVPQLDSLRRQLAPFDEARFKAAAAEALTRKSFVNDAITFVMERLRSEAQTGRAHTWQDDSLAKTRREIADVKAQDDADDALILGVPAHIAYLALKRVIVELDGAEDWLFRRTLEKQGLDGRISRGRIAAWLRMNGYLHPKGSAA